MGNRRLNDIQRTVRREADVPDLALGDQFPGRFQAPARADRPPQRLMVVDAVDAQQIDVREPQASQRIVEVGHKLAGIGQGHDLGLHDDPLARQPGSIWPSCRSEDP